MEIMQQQGEENNQFCKMQCITMLKKDTESLIITSALGNSFMLVNDVSCHNKSLVTVCAKLTVSLMLKRTSELIP